MQFRNSFGSISGLQLNEKKTKALWIGASRNNTAEPLKFQCPKDPIKFLGTFLSHSEAQNNDNNFFIKIRKMETRLDAFWQNDAGKILRFVPVNTRCFHACSSGISNSTDPT